MYWKLIVVCVLVPSVLAEKYDFEFGDNIGDLIFDKEDSIGILEHHTDIVINVPPRKRVTYVKVTVWALAPPKVDMDKSLNQVSIQYSLLQVSASKYRIIAKGVPAYH